MVTKGLIVQLEAHAGREEQLAEFLRDALQLVEREPQTTAWFAFRSGRSSFAIVDVFADDVGRRAHLEGPVATALTEAASELLAAPPEIKQVDVLAARLP
jgi:quinol monooxygenase YgiN